VRHLDPELHIDRSLRGTVAGKVMLVTGGSSGVGLAVAHKSAEAVAITLICGRDQSKLDAASSEAKSRGHTFIAYTVDITDRETCEAFVPQVTDNHWGRGLLDQQRQAFHSPRHRV